MAKESLPTYAIVELIIRLEKYNPKIGDYKGHAAYENEVIVRTSNGSIIFPAPLVIRQFESPELITGNELATLASLYKPTK